MDQKEKTLFIGFLILPILIFVFQGFPPEDAEGRMCFSTWKSHYVVSRILVLVLAVVGLFLFKNWFFKVIILIIMLMTAFFTYVSGWIWADPFC